MKHILFVIAACLVCLNALAGSDIKVKVENLLLSRKMQTQ